MTKLRGGLVPLVAGAALALSGATLVLVVVGWRAPSANESVDDYLECVSGCNALYPQEGPSRVACVEGCRGVLRPSTPQVQPEKGAR